MNDNTLSIITFVLMAGALYFILIRPQQMRQKQHSEMVKSLVRGDRVVTAGGLLGTLTDVGDDEVGVELAKGVEVRVMREAISRKVEE